ncbi:helix-turn-helix transcriptional regulator [Sphingobium nicotianae]|nr:LuxR C-terminal-related transcriptional regulator [Sphingobium nicotianae]
MARETADALADLVGAIGSERFPGHFHAALASLADVALCSAFRQDEDGTIRLILAQGALPLLADFPLHASLDYARTYWRADPQMRRLAHAAPGPPIVLRRSAAEIADPAYRAACYERAGIRERISIYRAGAPSLVANGYRTLEQAAFSLAEMAAIERHAGLLMAALERHEQGRAAAGEMHDETALMQSLMNLHCGLSAREAEVSAAMMLGETQAEIAARKRLSPDSVVTYRRRAYGKLGIANRRDLLRLHRRLASGERA